MMQLELFSIQPGDTVNDGRRTGTIRIVTRTWLYFECGKRFCACHGLVTDPSQAFHRVAKPSV